MLMPLVRAVDASTVARRSAKFAVLLIVPVLVLPVWAFNAGAVRGGPTEFAFA